MSDLITITASDTTPEPLNSKLLVENGVSKRTTNPGGDESLVLTLDVENLPLSTTATIENDFFPFFSTALGQNRRMTLTKLGELISAEIDVKDCKVSEDDSTSGFLFDKISIPANYGLAKSITNPLANELLSLVIDVNSLETISSYNVANTFMVVYDTTIGDNKPKKLLVPIGADLSNINSLLPTAGQKAALPGTFGTP